MLRRRRSRLLDPADASTEVAGVLRSLVNDARENDLLQRPPSVEDELCGSDTGDRFCLDVDDFERVLWKDTRGLDVGRGVGDGGGCS